MKNAIRKFYEDNEKKNGKLLKKMFGCKTLSDALQLEESARTELTCSLKKEIDLISFQDVKGNSRLMYLYTKYKTLSVIIGMWIENRKLYAFGSDYAEEIEK